MAFKTSVNPDKCNGCEACLEICSADMFKMRHGKAISERAETCVGCESCVEICKEAAITVVDTRVELSSTCLELLKDIL